MKKYVNKTTGDTVEQGTLKMYIGKEIQLPPHLVESSCDWEEVVEKEYEILSLITKNGRQILKLPFFDINNLIENQNCLIYSVKRVSDGEIFTVGDLCYPSSVKSNIGIINSIEFCKVGYLRLGSDNWYIGLENIQHAKKPLLITEDGKEIFGGELIHIVNSNYNNTVEYDVKIGQTYDKRIKKHLKYFSSREKAEEYILFNKPCLSLNDVFKVYPQIKRKEPFVNTAHANQLIYIAKKKL